MYSVVLRSSFFVMPEWFTKQPNQIFLDFASFADYFNEYQTSLSKPNTDRLIDSVAGFALSMFPKISTKSTCQYHILHCQVFSLKIWRHVWATCSIYAKPRPFWLENVLSGNSAALSSNSSSVHFTQLTTAVDWSDPRKRQTITRWRMGNISTFALSLYICALSQLTAAKIYMLLTILEITKFSWTLWVGDFWHHYENVAQTERLKITSSWFSSPLTTNNFFIQPFFKKWQNCTSSVYFRKVCWLCKHPQILWVVCMPT